MKKYIIKNADGSEQTVMRAIHNLLQNPARRSRGRPRCETRLRGLPYTTESRDGQRAVRLFARKHLLQD